MNFLKGNSRKVGRTFVGFADESTEWSILPPKGGKAMEYITLSDLVQIGIFMCSFILVILKILSSYKRK